MLASIAAFFEAKRKFTVGVVQALMTIIKADALLVGVPTEIEICIKTGIDESLVCREENAHECGVEFGFAVVSYCVKEKAADHVRIALTIVPTEATRRLLLKDGCRVRALLEETLATFTEKQQLLTMIGEVVLAKIETEFLRAGSSTEIEARIDGHLCQYLPYVIDTLRKYAGIRIAVVRKETAESLPAQLVFSVEIVANRQ